MSGVAHDSSGRAAGKPTLAERWYVPAEISALRVWLPFAALVNVLIPAAKRCAAMLWECPEP